MQSCFDSEAERKQAFQASRLEYQALLQSANSFEGNQYRRCSSLLRFLVSDEEESDVGEWPSDTLSSSSVSPSPVISSYSFPIWICITEILSATSHRSYIVSIVCLHHLFTLVSQERALVLRLLVGIRALLADCVGYQMPRVSVACLARRAANRRCWGATESNGGACRVR